MMQRLVHALQALAATADEQLARCPELVNKADEVALDYADALRLVIDCPLLVRRHPAHTLLQRPTA
jgi:hypothetical protein